MFVSPGPGFSRVRHRRHPGRGPGWRRWRGDRVGVAGSRYGPGADAPGYVL